MRNGQRRFWDINDLMRLLVQRHKRGSTNWPLSTTNCADKRIGLPLSTTNYADKRIGLPLSTTNCADKRIGLPLSTTNCADKRIGLPLSTTNYADKRIGLLVQLITRINEYKECGLRVKLIIMKSRILTHASDA